MQILSEAHHETLSRCGYLPDRQRQCSYFLAEGLSGAELDHLLERGWRKFGPYFFRPMCPGCRSCIPVRVHVPAFRPSRSQKRVLKRGENLQVRFGPLEFSSRVYDIYAAHAAARFPESDVSLDQFLLSFYCPSCPTSQTEIYLGDTLIAVGWLDIGTRSVSSVYFCFDPAYSAYRPGTFGILREIFRARELGRTWYYLGYHIPGNRATAYKDHFRPRQHRDWATGTWQTISAPPAPL